MLQLIKLEMKKYNFGWYVKGAIIANMLMPAMICFMFYIAQIEGDLFVTSYEQAFELISAMVRMVFIIFAAVLLAKLVIEEYKNRTILILFSYPISRKKIIASKLLIIGLLTFVTILLSNIFVAGAVFIINHQFEIISISVTTSEFIKEVIKMIPLAIAAAGASLIPLYFGMRKYSIPATIISSFLVVTIACSNNPEFSTSAFLPLQLGLAVVGVMIAYYGIRNVEKDDVA
ncbi:hypothetical protein BAMA_02775 [Bacillus manliponensis]|uniref:ABC transporter permease n=1 Tax=Bacillus manliponensis TaxID=574376 RepID=A0A073JXL8_9BACI|nr:ABC transporter permease [Bacillus manliponensis]KEK19010.1 hypothetical protein BAMA_02775 [Bacillus manliponensis]